MNKVLLSLTCFAFLVGLSGSASAATITSCGTVTEDSVLGADLYSSGACLTIGANNTVLDCAGYSITGGGSRSGISLSGVDNVTIRNCNVIKFGYGILLYSSSSNTLTNNIASSNEYGIHLDYSSNNTLTNNTIFNNSVDSYSAGIYFSISAYNTLSGNNMTDNIRNFEINGEQDSHFNQNIDTSNTVNGKPVYYVTGAQDAVYNSSTDIGFFACISCDNITVKDLIFTNNSPGVLFWNTNNSIIQNVTLKDNYWGLWLGYSNNNSIINNLIRNNLGYGVYLKYSNNNALTNNTVNSNEQASFFPFPSGIGIIIFSTSWSSGGNNTIYNNLFNTSNNFGFGGTIYSNDWNTTKTSGTNIIGGPYLGGNFWANPDGTGFSETCTDEDGDGICDSEYTLASGNVDYLPLSLNFTVEAYDVYIEKMQAPKKVKVDGGIITKRVVVVAESNLLPENATVILYKNGTEIDRQENVLLDPGGGKTRIVFYVNLTDADVGTVEWTSWVSIPYAETDYSNNDGGPIYTEVWSK